MDKRSLFYWAVCDRYSVAKVRSPVVQRPGFFLEFSVGRQKQRRTRFSPCGQKGDRPLAEFFVSFVSLWFNS
ncbi:hypothetical protein [Planktothricoides sp. SR001]|uniref:hypothetical protein n=1 Tax=Planktothricoides sp. SR001 TaxID=1705388 RepID=UPI0012E2BB06|nr:hypothetical protein [Planktothricoides sp. SR001]